MQQAEEQVLGADVAVVRSFGFLLGEEQDLLGPFSEPLEGVHGCPLTIKPSSSGSFSKSPLRAENLNNRWLGKAYVPDGKHCFQVVSLASNAPGHTFR